MIEKTLGGRDGGRKGRWVGGVQRRSFPPPPLGRVVVCVSGKDECTEHGARLEAGTAFLL